NNYCNCLSQGNIKISDVNMEEFYNYQKQVWIITQQKTRPIKRVNSIEVKEISVQDIMKVYQERLTQTNYNTISLEIQLRNL
ncbi:MAG: hypothetical protein AB4058_14005, partial [Microcystaceae cyanobacterium]